MRLIPGGAAGVSARQGRPFRAMRVLRSPGKMELDWDPARQRAMVSSDQVEGAGTLWIDANKLRTRQESALDPFDEPVQPGALAVDAADDVVLDLGMSKIVALTADRGWVSAEELERVVRDGLPTSLRPGDVQDKRLPPEITEDRGFNFPAHRNLRVSEGVENLLR
jgi:hypothetical protein